MKNKIKNMLLIKYFSDLIKSLIFHVKRNNYYFQEFEVLSFNKIIENNHFNQFIIIFIIQFENYMFFC